MEKRSTLDMKKGMGDGQVSQYYLGLFDLFLVHLKKSSSEQKIWQCLV